MSTVLGGRFAHPFRGGRTGSKEFRQCLRGGMRKPVRLPDTEEGRKAVDPPPDQEPAGAGGTWGGPGAGREVVAEMCGVKSVVPADPGSAG